MNIKNQVLSINQVQELQELGFDVNKYASMCWLAYASDEPPYQKEYDLSILDESCYELSCLAPIPTLTIGDVMDILPERIFGIYYIEAGKNYIDYCSNENTLNGFVEDNLIDALFEALKWCIKEKHLAL